MAYFIISVPKRPSVGASYEEFGVVEAPNELLARKGSASIVRWDPGRLVARPCDDSPESWITVGERLRYDTLTRMPKSVLSPRDRRFLEAMRKRKPL
jgi:hypothetical protein